MSGYRYGARAKAKPPRGPWVLLDRRGLVVRLLAEMRPGEIALAGPGERVEMVAEMLAGLAGEVAA